jgi:hypothetical protein
MSLSSRQELLLSAAIREKLCEGKKDWNAVCLAFPDVSRATIYRRIRALKADRSSWGQEPPAVDPGNEGRLLPIREWIDEIREEITELLGASAKMREAALDENGGVTNAWLLDRSIRQRMKIMELALTVRALEVENGAFLDLIQATAAEIGDLPLPSRLRIREAFETFGDVIGVRRRSTTPAPGSD